MYRWSLLLPDRLQEYGLTNDVWERIADFGDKNPRMQEILRNLMNKTDPLREAKEILKDLEKEIEVQELKPKDL